MTETRRVLLNDSPRRARVEGRDLVVSDGMRIPVAEAVHLPPVEPTKIIATHLTYGSRVEEFVTKLPPAPTYFHKPVSSLNGHMGDVVRPRRCRFLNFEGEIAIVIGEKAFNIRKTEAAGHIAGYTIANDFGLHDFRDTDAGSMLRAKGSNTLCPVGPGLVTDWDFRGKNLETLVNGEVKQSGNTDDMAWDMHYLVADIARTITLLPGDLILSGTPAGSRPVDPGDIVTVRVEGLGELTNRIVESDIAVRHDVGAQPSDSEEVLSTALGGDWEFRGVRAPRGAERHEPELEA